MSTSRNFRHPLIAAALLWALAAPPVALAQPVPAEPKAGEAPAAPGGLPTGLPADLFYRATSHCSAATPAWRRAPTSRWRGS